MGLYDTIMVYMRCPYCKTYSTFDAQTKDLGQKMNTYHTLDEDWEKSDFGKKFRKEIRVFPMNENDRGNSLWKSQAEKAECNAMVPKEYKKLKYIHVNAACHSVSCQFDADRDWIIGQGTPSGFGRIFHGKIRIADGKLRGEIFDIESDELKEEELEKYKEMHKETFEKLIRVYRHEPIVCRNWHRVK